MFKSARIYTLKDSTSHVFKSPVWLDDKLAEHQFTEIGPNDMYHLGWEPVLPGTNEFVHTIGTDMVVKLRKDSKIIPKPAVNKKVSEAVKKIESEQGRKVPAKERNQIREEIIQKILPTALSKTDYFYVLIMSLKNMLAVSTASESQSDEITSFLRKSMGSLPIRPLTTNTTPNVVMGSWLKENMESVKDFNVGDECTLTNHDKDKITFKMEELSEVTREYLDDNMDVKQMMVHSEELSMVVVDDLSIKKIKPTEYLVEGMEDTGTFDEMNTGVEANLFLIRYVIHTIVNFLIKELGGLYEESEDRAA